MDAMLSSVTIGVLGSGTDEHDDLAHDVGTLLAGLGVNLLTGGGQGVMASVSRAFSHAPRRRGVCIGIIPCVSEEERAKPRIGYPNEFVELAIYTHLPYSGMRGKDELSRNHINVLSSAALIALPGGHGTSAEVELALDYGKPLIAFARDAALVKHFPAAVLRASTIGRVEEFVRRHVGDAA